VCRFLSHVRLYLAPYRLSLIGIILPSPLFFGYPASRRLQFID
jgi:hypothetical protein